MNLESFLYSRFSMMLAYAIARTFPPAIGRPFGSWLGGWVARDREFSQVQAVRANQWVARGGQMSAEALDQTVAKTFRYTGHFLYDFLHFLTRKKQFFNWWNSTPAFGA